MIKLFLKISQNVILCNIFCPFVNHLFHSNSNILFYKNTASMRVTYSRSISYTNRTRMNALNKFSVLCFFQLFIFIKGSMKVNNYFRKSFLRHASLQGYKSKRKRKLQTFFFVSHSSNHYGQIF